ncbi:relaxase/mobilization nuclease domain-containing protein [Embleya sp. NBC_00896]|uniref:relaxase/mobilization nuclease domain-containing protein n=1 Tax=Embleya sp. NBC_00896 TaxID=2975961 RepID=UPI00386C157C|nr:relaxase/mobilization nuclease domain-containing protein [Embleya sp. NBC_00896]
MIAKLSAAHERHDDMAQLVTYLFGPGRANEHDDPHAIAASTGLEVDGDPASIAAQLDAPRQLFGIDVKHGSVWTAALSNAPQDRRLTDAEWATAARTLVDRLGFGADAGKAPCRWIAVRHGVSKRGNDHIHIAVSLVREDGTRANLWQDRFKASSVCAELERRFDLIAVEGRTGGRGLPGYSRANAESAARRGRAETERATLARHMRGAAVAAADEEDFVRRLTSSGIVVRPRLDREDGETVVGLSVALPPPDGTSPVRYGGGRLASDLSLPQLRYWWGSAARENDSAATSADDAINEPATGPTPAEDGLAQWTRAAADVARLRAEARGRPLEDAATWAGIAREVAGVFAVWSARAEPAGPGPLARAADVLARTAVLDAPLRRGPNLRSVAQVASRAPSPRESGSAQAALLHELRLTIDVIHGAEAAQRRTTQAARLGALDRLELAPLQERMTDDRTPRTPRAREVDSLGTG